MFDGKSFHYTATPTFAQVHQDPSRIIMIRGPVGSGKTSGCLVHLFLNSLNQQPSRDGIRRTRWAVIRATYPALKQTTIKTTQAWLGSMLQWRHDIPITAKLSMPHPDDLTTIEMELIFIALDSEDQVNKLQSFELTGAWLNEAAEIPEGVFQMVKSRVPRYPHAKDPGATRSQIICDYNSISQDHWLYRLAEEDRPPKHSFYTQPSALIVVPKGSTKVVDRMGNYYAINPEAENIDNLSKDYYEDMCYGADPEWINVFLLNNYGDTRSGRPVYTNYQDNIHYAKKDLQLLRGIPLVIGIDVGLTNAASFTQLSSTGSLNVLDELVADDCSVEKFAEDYLWPKIRNEYPTSDFYLVCDPAAWHRSQNDKQAAADILRKAGFKLKPAHTNNPLARREAVSHFLDRRDGFFLSGKCPVIRKGFISEYKFEKRGKATQLFKETAEKNFYSHPHDALQYAALEHRGGRGLNRVVAEKSDYYGVVDSVAGY